MAARSRFGGRCSQGCRRPSSVEEWTQMRDSALDRGRDIKEPARQTGSAYDGKTGTMTMAIDSQGS